MKDRFLSVVALAALLLVMVVSTASAKSWRINNNTAHRANFVDINAACASEEVTDGDTLYLDPGCNLTSEQTVTKRLTIVGTGYFFTDQPYAVASMSKVLNLKAAGIKVTGLQSSSDIRIYADNITIERCNVNNIEWCGKGQYVVIRQCWCRRIQGYSTQDYTLGSIIENNMIRGGDEYDSAISITHIQSSAIRYNYINSISYYYSGRYSYERTSVLEDVQNCSITNNIIWMNGEGKHNNLFYSLTNCQVTYNLLSCDEDVYPEYPNNTRLGTHELTSIFTCSGLNDHYYEMTEDSPAKAIQAGPFYGAHPYVFSGLPYGYPHYTAVSISPQAKDGKIRISLSSKVQDE